MFVRKALLMVALSLTAHTSALAEDLPMPSGFPTAEDFDKKQINAQEFAFSWERDPGAGGHNYGKDWSVDEGYVIVGWEIHTRSERNTKGNRDLKLNYTVRGPLRLPTGVHNGHRLTPGPLTGPGAAYKGTIKVYTVNARDWYVALK